MFSSFLGESCVVSACRALWQASHTMGFRDLARTVYFSIHGYVVQRKINAQEQVLPPYCKEHVLPLHCKVSCFHFKNIDMTL